MTRGRLDGGAIKRIEFSMYSELRAATEHAINEIDRNTFPVDTELDVSRRALSRLVHY